MPLRALRSRFRYLYDFGDGWEHHVVTLGPGGERPGVVSGEGACPPEDVGGPSGYAAFRKAMVDPAHPDHDALRTWAGPWADTFELDTTDLLVRQTVGASSTPDGAVWTAGPSATWLLPRATALAHL